MAMRGSMSLPGWESTSGSNSRTAKLTDDQVRDIRRCGESLSKIAKRYNITTRTAYSVRARRTYRSVKDNE